jgi:3',5'-cyclic AMP phosphodiesterase CpdA
MDIVFLYTTNEVFVAQYHQGHTPLQIAAHETVAEAYGLCSINFAADVTMRLDAGEFDWKTFGGVHPADFGNRIYANDIRTLLQGQWRDAGTQRISRAPLHNIDPLSYTGGRLLDVNEAQLGEGWQIHVPDWSSLPGGTRAQYNRIPLLCADTPGAELTLTFSGTAIGLYVAAGPDAGQVEYQIDGGPMQQADLNHRFSRGLHYPRTCMLAADLSPGDHELTLRIPRYPPSPGRGHAARIVAFAVNGNAPGLPRASDVPLSTVAGPYLQDAQAQSMTIQWITNTSATAWVEYRQGDGPYHRAVASKDGLISAAQTVHRVTLPNLSPGVPYHYRTVSREIVHFAPYHVTYGDRVTSNEASFTTLDPARTECDFVVVNDIHGNDPLFIKLMTLANQAHYDLAFLNGDILGDIDNESQFIQHLLMPTVKTFASEKPFVFVRGNHETRGLFARRLPDYITRPGGHYYGAFTHGPVRFVLLDSGEDKPDTDPAYSGLVDFDRYREEQTRWLKTEISSHAFRTAAFRVVLVHMPLYGSNDWHGPEHCRSQWADLINRAGVDLMISGHTHRQAVVAPQSGLNPYPVVIGGNPKEGGATLIRVHATPDRLTVTMLQDTGEIIKTFSLPE